MLPGRPAVDSIIEANHKSKAIEEFFAGGGDEIDINVKNISIKDLRLPPYHATVDIEKVCYSPLYHQERLSIENDKHDVPDRSANEMDGELLHSSKRQMVRNADSKRHWSWREHGKVWTASVNTNSDPKSGKPSRIRHHPLLSVKWRTWFR